MWPCKLCKNQETCEGKSIWWKFHFIALGDLYIMSVKGISNIKDHEEGSAGKSTCASMRI